MQIYARRRNPGSQTTMILRALPSGSLTMRHSLSKIIVWLLSGSVGCQLTSETDGLPVAAKAAHEEAILRARACASGVLPVPCSQRLVLSKQNCSSAVCHAPGRPSKSGVCQVK